MPWQFWMLSLVGIACIFVSLRRKEEFPFLGLAGIIFTTGAIVIGALYP